MYKTKFSYNLGKEKIKVLAKAKDVDAYGAVNLRFSFSNEEDEPIEIPYIKKVFEDLEEIASERLYAKKFSDELDFSS